MCEPPAAPPGATESSGCVELGPASALTSQRARVSVQPDGPSAGHSSSQVPSPRFQGSTELREDHMPDHIREDDGRILAHMVRAIARRPAASLEAGSVPSSSRHAYWTTGRSSGERSGRGPVSSEWERRPDVGGMSPSLMRALAHSVSTSVTIQ